MLSSNAALRKDSIAHRDVLQHRHFALIARILADDFSAYRRYSKEQIIERFAQSLGNTNNNFDYARFRRAAERHEAIK